MKKLSLIIIAVLMLASCQVNNYAVFTASVDYTGYARQGVFLTESNSVGFDYEPIGYVTATVYSGFSKDKEKQERTKAQLTKYEKRYYNGYVYASAEDALQALCDEAKKLGADGIINLKYNASGGTKNDPLRRWTASGMAIKRK